jgi:ribosomal protein L29
MGDDSEQPLMLRERRRDVARILTVMKERGL